MTPRALLAPARLAGQPILRTQSDDRLVDLVRSGSEPAFEAIVARYRRPLLRYCARILPDESAEDAVQQTFVRAYGAMRRSDAELNLRPWLYRIAHNTALNALRDRGLRQHEELQPQLDSVEQPDQALERSQGLREVLTAVQELPERQRNAILLRELEGRSYDEIAAELGVSGGAVRQLLNRARNTLRRAATAVTPTGLVQRLPWTGGEESMATRVAELCGAAGGGALAAKVCATALVTGAVVGGVAVSPETGREDAVAGMERKADGDRSGVRPTEPGDRLGERGASGAARRTGGDRRGGSGDGSDSSGPGSGGADNSGSGSTSSGSGSSGSGDSGYESSGSGSSGSGSSGSGSGGYDSSGSGSGEYGSSGYGSSGSGSGGYDSSGSGSGGYDSSGSGSSGSGSGDYDSSGSGSGSSGSGSSGSGDGGYDSSGSGSSDSGSSGSGSSGSGSSGSGSSGSGSSDDEDDY